MRLTRKTQYALRAALELARLGPEERARASAIARAQAIPVRFLETILHELVQGGVVVSRRGSRGGYRLARKPAALSVGEVIRLTQGATGDRNGDPRKAPAEPPDSDSVFLPLWQRVDEAVAGVVDAASFQDLLDWDAERAGSRRPLNYVI